MSDTYCATDYAEFVAFHLEGDTSINKWAQTLLHAAFSDFAEGYWSLGVAKNELPVLEWRCPATWDEPPVTMSITPEILVEAFKERITINEPYHPEDYANLKDAIAEWRRAVELIESMIVKTKVHDLPPDAPR